MTKSRYILALMLAAASGCAALAHELLWTRRLIDLLGASAESSARVFECFFLGLALGSAWVNRLIPKVHRPWRVVGAIELAIAILVLPAITLPGWTGWIWPWLGPERLIAWEGTVAKTAISILVVIPPAFAMGTTLPLLARAILTGNNRLGRHGIWLYAVNTVGGVLGLMIATTILLQYLGVAGSMFTALSLNLVVALGCFLMDYQTAPSDTLVVQSDIATTQPPKGRPSATILIASFGSGAGILAVEVLALHLFTQVVPSALHAVTAVLATVILLLAAAAFLTPILTPKFGSPRDLLNRILPAAGIAIAATPLMFMWVTGDMNTLKPSDTLFTFVLKMAGYVLIIVGPCLIAAGLVFPMVLAWFGTEGGDPYGRRWGWLLAANGVGGIVGAEFAQHILMPWFGMHAAMGLIGLGYTILASLLLIMAGSNTSRAPLWRHAGTALLIFAIGIVWLMKLPLIHPAPTKDIKFKTLSLRAGPEGVVAVTDSKKLGRGIVMFNQYVLGSTNALESESRQAHLPLTLHPDPQRVAFIGLATGVTAGAALAHPEVRTVEAVELSPLVADACQQHFSEFNGGIFSDPRAKVVVEDGRTYISSCTERFDVVIGDLFLPWRTGVGRLYSLEHFRDVKRSLRTGGLFCQMLPMYQFNREQTDTIIATVLRVFPKAHLFRLGLDAGSPVLAIMAYKDATLDWSAINRRCEAIRTHGAITDALVTHLDGLKMLYMAPVELDGHTQPINTLANARVEINAALGYVTGQWQLGYFMKWNQWLAFEDELLAHRIATDPSGSAEAIHYARLARQMTQWHWAQNSNDPNAHQLARELLSILPASIKPALQLKYHGQGDLLKRAPPDPPPKS